MISISAFSVRNSVEDPLQNADTAAVLMEGGMDAGRAYQMAGHRVVVSWTHIAVAVFATTMSVSWVVGHSSGLSPLEGGRG